MSSLYQVCTKACNWNKAICDIKKDTCVFPKLVTPLRPEAALPCIALLFQSLPKYVQGAGGLQHQWIPGRKSEVKITGLFTYNIVLSYHSHQQHGHIR